MVLRPDIREIQTELSGVGERGTGLRLENSVIEFYLHTILHASILSILLVSSIYHFECNVIAAYN